MARDSHEIKIVLRLEPGEHPAEGAAWDELVARVRALVAEASADPRLAVLDLDPRYDLEVEDGPYGIDPRVLNFREGQQVTFTSSATDRYGTFITHPPRSGVATDEPRHGEHGIIIEIRTGGGATFYVPLDSISGP
ncbi:hypothetical protein AB0395_35105 [Streptosporangium sp. NPDC051023]|uniref:hypothetical protein n=1 Tax=Streptosporangium sp. NPDC051023 TaxID=3155410 RepID=UPI00344E7FBC